MKHYINSNLALFAFESDGSQDHLITKDMVLAPLDANGKTYKYYTSDVDGNIVADTTKIDADNAAKVVSDNWASYGEYVSTLTVTTAASNKFAVDSEALKNVAFKRDALADTSEILWVESWGAFNTTKVELQEVIVEADKKMQAKIVELFGTV